MADPVTLFFNLGFILGASTAFSVVGVVYLAITKFKGKKDD